MHPCGLAMRHNQRVTSDDVPSTGGDSAGERRSGDDFPRSGTFRRGYDVAQVDTFLHEAERALRRNPPTMAPYEVQDARFRGVRWGKGYAMRPVDERMEELHAALRERHGDRGVSSIQGNESARQHRVAFWVYVTGALLVAAILAFAMTQMI